jgi:hypothetical protein
MFSIAGEINGGAARCQLPVGLATLGACSVGRATQHKKVALDFSALMHASIEKWLVLHLCRMTITPNRITLGTEAARPELR